MFENLIEFIQTLLGTYEPVSYPVYEIAPDVEVVRNIIPSGLAGVDWRYIFTGLVFLVTIYSVFRLLGILLQSIGGRK